MPTDADHPQEACVRAARYRVDRTRAGAVTRLSTPHAAEPRRLANRLRGESRQLIGSGPLDR